MWLLQQRLAQEILTTLKEHPDAWTRVDTILEYSQNQQTKYYALQILENVIKTRWKVLPRPQCEGMKQMFFFWWQYKELRDLYTLNYVLLNGRQSKNIGWLQTRSPPTPGEEQHWLQKSKMLKRC